jgi:hypothetical protein
MDGWMGCKQSWHEKSTVSHCVKYLLYWRLRFCKRLRLQMQEIARTKRTYYFRLCNF